MILPTPSLPEAVTEKIPSVSQWVENAKKDGHVLIGVVGQTVYRIPGILESVEVSDALNVDDVDKEGKGGKVKVVHGWNDCDLSLTFTLIDIPVLDAANYRLSPKITRYDCLKEIVGYFKDMDAGKPKIYTIHHPHVAAWGAKEFIFNDLKSSEGRKKRTIICTLNFDEYDSTTGKSQDRHISTQAAQESASPTPKAPPVSEKARGGLGKLEERHAPKR